MDLVTEVYRATGNFPETEKFGLVIQLRRAAVSIPSNIAEGQGRASTGEFRQFLGHARGSLCEVITQLEISESLGYLCTADTQTLLALAEDVARLLNALIRSLGPNGVREEPDEYFN